MHAHTPRRTHTHENIPRRRVNRCSANLMRIKKFYTNTQYITNSESEFPVKGSGTSPYDSSKLWVEVLQYLSWLNTSVSTQTISSMYFVSSLLRYLKWLEFFSCSLKEKK